MLEKEHASLVLMCVPLFVLVVGTCEHILETPGYVKVSSFCEPHLDFVA